MDLANGTVIEASNIVEELNACLTWVSYPGRTNGTARAADIDFAIPGGAR
jgi:hypothetical protein